MSEKKEEKVEEVKEEGAIESPINVPPAITGEMLEDLKQKTGFQSLLVIASPILVDKESIGKDFAFTMVGTGILPQLGPSILLIALQNALGKNFSKEMVAEILKPVPKPEVKPEVEPVDEHGVDQPLKKGDTKKDF